MEVCVYRREKANFADWDDGAPDAKGIHRSECAFVLVVDILLLLGGSFGACLLGAGALGATIAITEALSIFAKVSHKLHLLCPCSRPFSPATCMNQCNFVAYMTSHPA